MTKEDYEKLINKYQTKQPGEIWSKESETQNKQYQRTTSYTQTCQIIMDCLNIKGEQRKHAIWIVENIPLEELHRTANSEMIIAAICFYVKKLFNPNIQFKDYSILRHYNLSLEMTYLICCRIASYAFSKSYLVPIETDMYNHKELYETEASKR